MGSVAVAATFAASAAGRRRQRRLKGRGRAFVSWLHRRSAENVGDDAPPPEVAVVGAGLAGLGAALACARAGLKVTLLDASPRQLGEVPLAKDPGGRTFSNSGSSLPPLELEFGQKGIWSEYPNLLALIDEVVPGGQAACLTRPTSSGFWSNRGLESNAPIFGNLPKLPAPLGSFAWTAPSFQFLGPKDRLTTLPLVPPLLDALEGDEATRSELDAKSAEQLFEECEVSPELRKHFIDPLLKALIFRPPSELSALTVLEVLWAYALKTQSSFDVRWFRGPLDEMLIRPIARELELLGVRVESGARLTELGFDDSGRLCSLRAERGAPPVAGGGTPMELRPSACVLATGVAGLRRIADATPELRARSPEVAGAVDGLSGIDCTAVRLILDRRCETRFASNVIANLDGMGAMGGTYFVLERTQPRYRRGAYARRTSVAVDLYGSEELRDVSDENVVARAMSFLRQTEPAAFRGAEVEQWNVLRARGAATHFCPGSLKFCPPQRTGVPNLFLAGDFVRGLASSAGLSQERALTAGYTAANMAIEFLDDGPTAAAEPRLRQKIEAASPDEPHVAVLRSARRGLRQVAAGAAAWLS